MLIIKWVYAVILFFKTRSTSCSWSKYFRVMVQICQIARAWHG